MSLGSEDFYCTIGVHPCRANEPFKDIKDGESKAEYLQKYIQKIEEILESSIKKEKFVAIGECGLDYDRFEYADKET